MRRQSLKRRGFEIGKARLLREGSEVALISTGLMTPRALEAAAQLAAEGTQRFAQTH